MITTDCYLSSPIHISEKKSGLIPYIRSKDRVYMIKEKLFYEILNKIGLYQEFNAYVRENGYNKTSKWLNKYGFLNTEFLEEVSYYSIEALNFKKISNYSFFQKDCNLNPHISGEYLKHIFKKVFIYRYLKERKSDFNCHVEKILEIACKELDSVKDKTNYINRINFYRKNLFNLILENFLINNNDFLLSNLQTIENASIYTLSYLNSDDLILYKVGNPVSFFDFKYKITNVTYQECLRKDTYFKIFIDIKNSAYAVSFLNILLENTKILAEDKFSFDKQYISKLSDHNRNYLADENQPEFKYFQSCREQVVLKEKYENYQLPDLINLNFNAVKNSNLFLSSLESINNLITTLNLNGENLEKINFVMSGKSKIEANLINLSIENNLIPYYEIGGYGNIYYN